MKRVERRQSQHHFHQHDTEHERDEREQHRLADELQRERRAARAQDLADADGARAAARARRREIHVVDAGDDQDEHGDGRAPRTGTSCCRPAASRLRSELRWMLSKRLQIAVPAGIERLAELRHVPGEELPVDAIPLGRLEIRTHHDIGEVADVPQLLATARRVLGVPDDDTPRPTDENSTSYLRWVLGGRSSNTSLTCSGNARIGHDDFADGIGVAEVLAREAFRSPRAHPARSSRSSDHRRGCAWA